MGGTLTLALSRREREQPLAAVGWRLAVGGPTSAVAGCGITQQVDQFRLRDSVGETPTDAVETTALPEKSPMIGAKTVGFPKNLPRKAWA
jgi:hypothetical protein